MTEPRMTNAEAVLLCRYTKACCPQQQFDQFTPDAWFELLNDFRFEDCKLAVTQLAKRQPFVAPAEIRDEVHRIRTKRIDLGPTLTPPPDLDPVATNEWLREARRRVADGEHIDTDAAYGDLKDRNLGELKALMPRVPRRSTTDKPAETSEEQG